METDHEDRIRALEQQYKRLKTIIDISDDSDKKIDLIVDLLWYVQDWQELKRAVLKQLPELLTAIKEVVSETGSHSDGVAAPKGQFFVDVGKLMVLERILYDIGILGD